MKNLHTSVREVAVLQEATEMILTSMDADTVLHHILLVVRNYFNISTCAVLLADPATSELYVHTQNGFDNTQILDRRLKIGRDGITGHVAETKSPMYVPDVRLEPRYISARDDIRSELAIPLIVRDDVIGVLDVQSSHVDHFTDEMIGLLAVFAGQAAVALENARLYSTERRRMRQIEFVNLIARSATTANDIDHLLNTLSELIGDTFENSQVSILLRNPAGKLVLRAHAGPDEPDEKSISDSIRNGIIAEALAARLNAAVNDVSAKCSASPSWTPLLPDSMSELGVPLLSMGETLGVIVVSETRLNAFNSDDRSIAQAAGDVCATAIRNVQLSEELMRVANTDTLTGVFNQRYFHIAVGHEITRAKRFAKTFCVVMFDLDGFKEINQRYGFDAGDETLRSVAQLLRSSVRAIDTISRYATDRFSIVLPETEKGVLDNFQRKIKDGLVKIPYARGVITGRLTARFATVQYPDDGTSELELVRHLLNRIDLNKQSVTDAEAS